MRGRLPLPPVPGQTVGGGVPDAPETFRQHPGRDYNPCLPPWGKVAPQGRMRGRLPLPPVPGLSPAETPAAANTRGGVKTPPYGPNH